MSIAREWSAYARMTAGGPLPAEVDERARLCLADHLHAAMHGGRSETATLLRGYFGSERHAFADVLTPEALALYAGAVSAVHEIDDVHQDTSLHPGSAVVAAALAAASGTGVSGPRLLAAIVAGYEVAVRLSVAAGHRHYHFFHATATCGSIGAAVAAAVVFALEEEAIVHAIGMAATSAAGLWEGINDEAVTIKHLHPGLAAERGVRAANLARIGLRSARHAIEGEKGFLSALAQPGECAPAESPTRKDLETTLIANLGEKPAILRNIFKRYPFCLGCFEPLEGIRYLLGARSGRTTDIVSLRVEASQSVAWMVGQADPGDEFQAKFSAPYALALVLAGRDVERVPLPSDLLTDGEVRGWMNRVRVDGDAGFRRRRARVTLTLQDGTSEVADRPFRNLDDNEVWSRFANAAHGCLGGHEGMRLERSVGACAELSDTRELLRLAWAAMQLAPPRVD